MKRKKIDQPQERVDAGNIFSRIFIASLLGFVFIRFWFGGLAYPTLNYIINIYFLLLAAAYIIINRMETILTKEDILLLLFFLISVISSYTSEIKGSGISFGAQIMAYWAIFFLIVRTFDRPAVKWLCYSIFVSALLIHIFGLYQHFWGLEATRQYLMANPEIMSQFPPTFLDRLLSDRIFSTFLYPNLYATFILFIIPLSFFLFLSKKENPLLRGLYLLLLIISFYNLLLTESTGGIIVLLIVAQTMLLFLLMPKKAFVTAVSLLLVLQAALLFSVYAAGRLPKMDSVVDRTRYWGAAVEVFREKPMLGVGPENFRHRYLKHKHPESMEAKHAHSIIFESLAETGVTGTSALFLFMLSVLALLFKRARESPAGAGLAFGFLAVLLHNIIDFGFIEPSTGVLFFIAGAAGLANSNQKEGTKRFRLTKAPSCFILIVVVMTIYSYSRVEVSYYKLRNAQDQRDINAAIQHIDAAQRWNPYNHIAFEQKGDIFFHAGEIHNSGKLFREAERLYAKSVSLNPYAYSAYRKLAFLYESIDEKEKAEQMYMKVLDIYPVRKQFNIETAIFFKERGESERFDYYYNKSRELFSATIEEEEQVREYIEWIKSQK